jgi:hypothetical protein
MIRIETEYENAQEKLDQQQETLQRQREQLEEMDLLGRGGRAGPGADDFVSRPAPRGD